MRSRDSFRRLHRRWANRCATPELYFENNVGGSISLFTAMVRAGVRYLVFSSTAAVYGTPHTSPILEDFPDPAA